MQLPDPARRFAGSSVRSGWVWRMLPIESETVSPSNGRFAVSIS